MEGDAEESEQGKISPFPPARQGELLPEDHCKSQNDHADREP